MIAATGAAIALALSVAATTAEAAPSSDSATTTTTTTTVRRGDSLVGIANRFGVRLSALLQANSMSLASVIHPGDTLVIPAGAITPANSTASSAGSSTGSSASVVSSSATTYVVKAGDALAGIAWRHGVKLGALVKANGMSVDSLILPGQTLRVPPATQPLPAPRTVTSASGPAAASGSSTSATSTSASVGTTQGGSLQTLLSYATAQAGAPYRFFSAGPDAFDCSGLVVAAFRSIGMAVPHQSRALARMGTAVDWATEPIAAGDLVFTSAVNDPALITHVGIALDSRRWIHAVGLGRTVSITSLPAPDKVMAVQRVDLP